MILPACPACGMRRLRCVAWHVLRAAACDGAEDDAEAGPAGVGLIVGVSARRLSGGMLLVEWGAGEYCYHIRCYWGTGPDRQAILAQRRVLFVGWSDGAENFVVCEDPAPEARNLHFVLQDAASQATSRVFALAPPSERK
uniref:Uncharacterized protein n=1 Tax=Alexandrium monilatum TaxID=311494 RepID=A0A7S4Q9R4_9DINO|mmetsp:Transcript_56220/g.176143  ORF Transcript_56220/g.176143 Transcript_56220/m.176143 type:complete len:140 (+) Transcript_56220:42-461(+)